MKLTRDRWRAPALLVLLALSGCRSAQGPGAIRYDTRTQWGSIVLFDWSSDCFVIAGPPRLYAVRGERIIWRVYNACRESRPASVSIRNLRRVGDLTLPGEPIGYFPDKPRTTEHPEGYPAARPGAGREGNRPSPSPSPSPSASASPADARKGGSVNDPLEAGDRTIGVERGGWRDLEVRVRADAFPGRYTYVVVVDGRPDQDQEIDIWH